MKIDPDKIDKEQNGLFIDGFKDLNRETVEWYLTMRLCLEMQAYQSLRNDEGEKLVQEVLNNKTEPVLV